MLLFPIFIGPPCIFGHIGESDTTKRDRRFDAKSILRNAFNLRRRGIRTPGIAASWVKTAKRLYRNLRAGNNTVEVRLMGTRSKRDAIGARVCAIVNSRRIFKWVKGGNGFGTLNSLVVHIGIEIVEGQDALRTIVRFRAK